MQIYSQRDPKWMDKPLPNASNPNYITIKNFGCLLTCLANFAQVPPDEIMASHPDCFNSGGYMQTDKLFAYYGLKIRKEPHTAGTPMPVSDKPYIAVTSYFKKLNPDWGTHFYIRKPDGTSIDPSSIYNPKTVDRYESTVFEIRYVEPIGQTTSNTLTLEQRVKRIEEKLGIVG